MKNSAYIFTVIVALLLPLGLQAAPITFSYSGQISIQDPPFFDAGYAVGTPIVFSYTFDPDAITSVSMPDSGPDVDFTIYHWEENFSFELTVGSDVYTVVPNGSAFLDIKVADDYVAGPNLVDRYLVRVGGAGLVFPNSTSSNLIGLNLFDAPSSLLASEDLPLTPLDLAGSGQTFFGAHLQFSIDGPVVVPLPGGVWLLLSALGIAAGVARRG